MNEVVAIAARVSRALEAAGASHLVGGSVASALWSEPRMTNDIDFLVALEPDRIDAFLAALGDDFIVDDVSLRDEARRRGSWNIFYKPMFFKIGLFFARNDAFTRSQLARRRRLPASMDGETLWVASPEDVILKKLDWHRKGGGVSELRWRDVVRVLQSQAATLDFAYLEEWAAALALQEAYKQALTDAGVVPTGAAKPSSAHRWPCRAAERAEVRCESAAIRGTVPPHTPPKSPPP